MSDILAVRDLEKSFGAVTAARDISLTIPVEQTVGIIGANGAGKTTFINMITGHLTPSKGSIHFEGKDITGLPSRAITRLGISRSFQVAQVFMTMTVLDNMRIATAIANGRDSILDRVFSPIDGAETSTQADAALELFQIEHDMEIVGRFADRVLAFYDGTVIADDWPAAVLADPKVQTLISGTARAHVGEPDA
jgi:branched-chain amino acid transport system ATP-binding protein